MPRGAEGAGEFGHEPGMPVPTVFEAVGCVECASTGYHGRRGIYELLEIDEELRKKILTRASADQLKALAVERGMRTLRDDGWRKVRDGNSSVSEVLRVTQEE